MTTETTRAYGAPSMEHDAANHDLHMWWHHFNPETSSMDTVVEVRIPVEQIPDFLRQVTSHSMYAVEGAAQAIAYGDCKTCSNVRLVDAPAPGGRTQQVYCPDCAIPRHEAFENLPTVGPKIKEGFEQ